MNFDSLNENDEICFEKPEARDETGMWNNLK